jgi:PelA/Pel-15E family pectate lyase
MRRSCLWAAAICVAWAAGAVCGADAPSFAGRADAWFGTAEGRQIIDNILTWQGHGPGGVMGWPKAYDATKPRPAIGGGVEWEGTATIDNNATYTELRLLARAVGLEKDEARKRTITAAFEKGLDAMFAAQYENGGWPQRWPKPANYGSHITFNDNAMTHVMVELKEIGAGKAPFGFVDEARRKKAREAFDKGVDCILKCQIVVVERDAQGQELEKLTGWCAQHDEVTLKPANARAYELASISGSEGAEVLSLLMGIEKPDERTKKAIAAGAAWFEAAKIVGKRVQNTTAANGSRDRVVVDDPASTIWARFYDVQTGKPIFCGRDGVKKATLAEIEQERRAGYAWYGNWGANVAREYAAWKKRMEG